MSLEFNKIAAAVLTAGIVAMASSIIARELFDQEPLELNAYQVAVSESAAATPTESAPVIESVLPLLATADVAKGQAIFKACAACHDASKGGPNKVGPNLYGVVGRLHAVHEGYSYSQAMSALKDKPWNYEELNHFLFSPKNYVPGTKMTYAGLKKTQDRADVIAYLRTLADDPVPLPTQEEIDAATKGAEGGEAPAAGGEAAPAGGEQPQQ